jgi:hypothetical protein
VSNLSVGISSWQFSRWNRSPTAETSVCKWTLKKYECKFDEVPLTKLALCAKHVICSRKIEALGSASLTVNINIIHDKFSWIESNLSSAPPSHSCVTVGEIRTVCNHFGKETFPLHVGSSRHRYTIEMFNEITSPTVNR